MWAKLTQNAESGLCTVLCPLVETCRQTPPVGDTQVMSLEQTPLIMKTLVSKCAIYFFAVQEMEKAVWYYTKIDCLTENCNVGLLTDGVY